jgi:hypothetical protein
LLLNLLFPLFFNKLFKFLGVQLEAGEESVTAVFIAPQLDLLLVLRVLQLLLA